MAVKVSPAVCKGAQRYRYMEHQVFPDHPVFGVPLRHSGEKECHLTKKKKEKKKEEIYLIPVFSHLLPGRVTGVAHPLQLTTTLTDSPVEVYHPSVIGI